jgi:flagellin
MGMSINFNQASSIAQRNLQSTGDEITSSMSKLSSGKRVVNAKDDAGAMAIGAKLNLQSRGLKKVVNNITQATSTMQIAEGAMVRVNAMLERMSELAVQAGSANLSNTERGFLNTEYQQLTAEINRVTAGTKFGNTTLDNGSIAFTTANNPFTTGVVDLAFGNLPGNGQGTANALQYEGNGTSGVFTYTQASIAAGGVPSMSMTGAIDSSLLGMGTNMATGTSVKLSLPVGASNNLNGSPPYIIVNLNSNFNASQTIANTNNLTFAGSNQTALSFKVGLSALAADTITAYISGVNTASLGLTNSNISTTDGADSAAESIRNAVDVLITARAYIGALSSRLDNANQNQAVVFENTDAAQSAYSDVDIAMELSKLTGQQIKQQAAVSMVTQANQMPKDILKLFQQ